MVFQVACKLLYQCAGDTVHNFKITSWKASWWKGGAAAVLAHQAAPTPLQQGLYLCNLSGEAHTFPRVPWKALLLTLIIQTFFPWENICWVRQWMLGCWQGMELFKGLYTSVFTGKPYQIVAMTTWILLLSNQFWWKITKASTEMG